MSESDDRAPVVFDVTRQKDSYAFQGEVGRPRCVRGLWSELRVREWQHAPFFSSAGLVRDDARSTIDLFTQIAKFEGEQSMLGSKWRGIIHTQVLAMQPPSRVRDSDPPESDEFSLIVPPSADLLDGFDFDLPVAAIRHVRIRVRFGEALWKVVGQFGHDDSWPEGCAMPRYPFALLRHAGTLARVPWPAYLFPHLTFEIRVRLDSPNWFFKPNVAIRGRLFHIRSDIGPGPCRDDATVSLILASSRESKLAYEVVPAGRWRHLLGAADRKRVLFDDDITIRPAYQSRVVLCWQSRVWIL